jgi:hypothetical protein
MAEEQTTFQKLLKKGKMLGLALAMTVGAVGCTQPTHTPKRSSSSSRHPAVSHQQSVRRSNATKAGATQGWTISSTMENSSARGRTYRPNPKETGVLNNGVLMPNPGENEQEYEARRARLERACRTLHKKMVGVSRKRWLDLKNSGADVRLVDAAAKAYADHLDGTKEVYYSYYSDIGQKKLKYGSAYGRTNSTNAGTRSGGQINPATMNAVNAKRGEYVPDF